MTFCCLIHCSLCTFWKSYPIISRAVNNYWSAIHTTKHVTTSGTAELHYCTGGSLKTCVIIWAYFLSIAFLRLPPKAHKKSELPIFLPEEGERLGLGDRLMAWIRTLDFSLYHPWCVVEYCFLSVMKHKLI